MGGLVDKNWREESRVYELWAKACSSIDPH